MELLGGELFNACLATSVSVMSSVQTKGMDT